MTSVTVVLNKALPLGVSATVALEITSDGSAALIAVGEKGNAEMSDLQLGATDGSVTILGGRDRVSAQLIVNHDVDAVDEKS